MVFFLNVHGSLNSKFFDGANNLASGYLADYFTAIRYEASSILSFTLTDRSSL